MEESTSGAAGTLKQEIVTVWVRVGLRGFSTIDIETQLDDTIPSSPIFYRRIFYRRNRNSLSIIACKLRITKRFKLAQTEDRFILGLESPTSVRTPAAVPLNPNRTDLDSI